MTEPKIGHANATQPLSQESLHLSKEVRSIQRRAAEHDRRIVSIGPLVLFSTDTGDAWILEPAQQLATKVAFDGGPLPVHIEEAQTTFAIGWQGHYRIGGDTFTYEDNQSGRLVAIQGYPVKQLLRTISKAGQP